MSPHFIVVACFPPLTERVAPSAGSRSAILTFFLDAFGFVVGLLLALLLEFWDAMVPSLDVLGYGSPRPQGAE